MKIKNINLYSILLLVAGFQFVACDEQLDIQPQQSIDESTALSTAQNVRAALIGAYDGLADNDVWGGGQHLSELFADNGEQIWAGTFEEPEQIFFKEILIQNADVERFWTEGYETINRANNVLEGLSVLDPSEVDEIEGAAKFIRAAVYFDLVNLFGKTWIDGDPSANLSVPLVLTPTRGIDESSNVARNTVGEIYTQILADLNDAKAKLPETNNGLATTYAASALLSRVYLMQENFAEALNEASRVIEMGGFELVANYADAFNQSGNTSEDIFAIEVTAQDGVNDFITFYSAQERGGRGDIDITETHLAEYEEGDARRDLFYTDDLGIPRTGKWVPNSSQDGNINVIRLAEMYLTRAEARLETGDAGGAAEDINVIRARAGLGPVDAGSLTKDAILAERKLELMFEGHLYRDSKRTRKQIGDFSFDSDALVYPIPQRELDANVNLAQNPGY
ncbi:MAG: RagB/SusD family nutrient uptake outer membrane protein [Bacteroidota bacterium]